MFVDETLDATEVLSSWKKTRSTRDGECQTTGEKSIKDRGSQSYKTLEVDSQTELKLEETAAPKVDENALAKFLKHVEPIMTKMLKHGFASHAFDGFEVNWGDDSNIVTNIHTLRNAELEEQLQVTGLSWNSTGAVIAASYGRFDHEDWCTHRSCLCTWNLDRRGLDPDKPFISIDVPSCLMCIAFHPQNPALIAGGTFNGEVIIWDTSKGGDDDPVSFTSGIGDDSHREPVGKVIWMLDPESTSSKYNIMSISSDGRMLLWKRHSKKPILTLKEGFILLSESIPRSLRKTTHLNQEIGVTCMSVSKDHKSTGTFLIGSESGGIFKCNTQTKGTPARRDIKCSVQLNSPVQFSYGLHHGPVYSVECSPFHRNVFLSCGTDNSIRLSSVLQAAPLLEIEAGCGYLYALKWSPSRPMVFAVATETGKLLIYDLRRSKTMPDSVLEANDRKIPLYSLQFNEARDRLLATGDGMGFIQIWQLNSGLSEQEPKELEALDAVAETAVEFDESKTSVRGETPISRKRSPRPK